MFVQKVALVVIMFFFIFVSFGQPNNKNHEQQVKEDSILATSSNKPRPYNQVITSKAITKYGLIVVHRIDDKFYFEIPDSVFNTDLLSVNRIAKSASENRSPTLDFGYGGDLINSRILRFEQGPNNKVFIRAIEYASKSSDTTQNGLFKSFVNSNIQPIIAAFDVKAYSANKRSIVIDVTEFLNSDNPFLFLDATKKASLNLAAFQQDKSYVQDVLSFETNVDIKVVKTYMRSPGFNFTYELNSSLIALPKKEMKSRAYDSRIGYFYYIFRDYDGDPQSVHDRMNILKWNLRPKADDMQRYLGGQLVEPEKPIVFYIDPATPQKWISSLINGVNDWQKAFEKAGFKNAIYAREAPTYLEDSTWSIEDARYSVITYKTSAFENASGMCIPDPRNGQILLSHVNWYHNVIKLVHDWYFIQASAIDPEARKSEINDSLMGELIRFVCAHEIGHTLGLAHNFGASCTVPVDSLRSKTYLDKNGICPSIMDYARFNYVAQPEDKISRKEIFPRIGVYDEWAIEWGYRLFPDFNSQKEERAFLEKWVVDKIGKQPMLWFGSQGSSEDPRCQSEDLGDDAMKASMYGIKNLQRILPHLIEWLKAPEEKKSSGNVKEMYEQVVLQYERYIGHVVRNIGGVQFTPLSWSQEGNTVVFVGREKQKQAINFLNKELFKTPAWLIDEKWTSLIGGIGPWTLMQFHEKILRTLLSQDKLTLYMQEESNLKGQAYSLNELLSDLQLSIFKELPQVEYIDIYRRNLQRAYVTQVCSLLKMPVNYGIVAQIPYKNLNTDILADVKANLRSLLKKINSAINKYADKNMINYLIDIKERVEESMKPKFQIETGN